MLSLSTSREAQGKTSRKARLSAGFFFSKTDPVCIFIGQPLHEFEQPMECYNPLLVSGLRLASGRFGEMAQCLQ